MIKFGLFLMTFCCSWISFAQITLSQTNSNAITPSNSIVCSVGSFTEENTFYRAFNLDALGYDSFDVQRVDFAVEAFTEGTSPYFVEVLIYSVSDGVFPTATLNLERSQLVEITTADVNTLKQITLTSPVIISSAEMVIGLRLTNGVPANVLFYLGSNANGQSAPVYMLAPACSITTPTDIASIGFPNMHLILNVSGNATLSLNDLVLGPETYMLYPNPVANSLKFHFVLPNEVEKACVFNNLGQKMDLKYENESFDFSQLSRGIYLLSIQTKLGSLTKKIIKE